MEVMTKNLLTRVFTNLRSRLEEWHLRDDRHLEDVRVFS